MDKLIHKFIFVFLFVIFLFFPYFIKAADIDTVAPKPVTNLSWTYDIAKDQIHFSWLSSDDNTCSGCEAPVGKCQSATNLSDGGTKIACDPSIQSAYWWQISEFNSLNVPVSTPKPYYYYNGSNKGGISSDYISDQRDIYIPCGASRKHNLFRLDIEPRDARGNMVGEKNGTWPNVKSVKASCCMGQEKGNADCSTNEQSSTINENDYSIWECEFLNNGSCLNRGTAKWADFDSNTVVTLKDFEIWRQNQQ